MQKKLSIYLLLLFSLANLNINAACRQNEKRIESKKSELKFLKLFGAFATFTAIVLFDKLRLNANLNKSEIKSLKSKINSLDHDVYKLKREVDGNYSTSAWPANVAVD